MFSLVENPCINCGDFCIFNILNRYIMNYREELIKSFKDNGVNFDSGKADYVDDSFESVLFAVLKSLENYVCLEKK